MTINTADLISECSWTPASRAAQDGYDSGAIKLDYFGPLDETYPSRDDGLIALRNAYQGPDCDGIGLRIPDDGESTY